MWKVVGGAAPALGRVVKGEEGTGDDERGDEEAQPRRARGPLHSAMLSRRCHAGEEETRRRSGERGGMALDSAHREWVEFAE